MSPSVPSKVVVVEDDAAMALAVSVGLRSQGYRVRTAASAGEGIELASEWTPDLVLLDLMLPDNEGPEVFRHFRDVTDAALLGMTARSALADVVAGLRAGADDYITKPFDLDVLTARVEAALRRRGTAQKPVIRMGELVVDPGAGTAEYAGHRIDLTAMEFRLLTLLARRAGQIVTQDQIRAQLWSADAMPASNVVDVHVNRLRRKLEGAGGAGILQTRRRMGYVLQ